MFSKVMVENHIWYFNFFLLFDFEPAGVVFFPIGFLVFSLDHDFVDDGTGVASGEECDSFFSEVFQYTIPVVIELMAGAELIVGVAIDEICEFEQ